MAEFHTRTEITTKRIVALDLPSNWVEVEKCLVSLRHYLKDHNVTEWDDSVTVEADEDELRFVLVVPNKE